MDIDTILFLLLVAVGASVQTMTGFAMGLIVIGGVTALDLAEIQFTAAVISLISLVNTIVALRPTWRFIDFGYFKSVVLGITPMLVVGVLLLELLSRESYELLRSLLGVVIIVAGVMMMLKPKPWERQSPAWAATSVGCAGGIIAGLYSAGGAPLAYFMYRQPVDIRIIRATLLSIFALSTAGRTIVVGFAGHLTKDVWLTTAIAVPLVIVMTLVVSRINQYAPDALVRRLAFILLVIIGGFLMLK
ncbi:MAG: sulfite exporter TauE/SafE family protein [Pseudomonadales bacterium]|nr:sulfite exporter TauE/SafE family protein [Pseudomonadales bacterium]